ncbi:flagellar export protein FliJ [Bdellovibrio sp. HCB337]|uniref:flagellar export protein FliJ n=1 Tax=Bdellovibrio sp. HCB337 TaxID=3394358 RepID=UPI0039A41D89
MKFKFPLQKVLDHRKIKEDLAQKDFQEALMVLTDLKNKLQEMETSIHDAHLRMGLLQKQGGAQGPALTQINDFIKNQKILIQRQIVKIQQQDKVVEDKRELLRQAAIETKIIAKFKEKKFDEYKHERESEEQKEMDEQSILRFKHIEKRGS